MGVELTVVGSINLDLVLRLERLPRPGETVSGGELARFPGGKGANQAVAAARLGASVRMVGAVGDDAFADEALVGLRDADVDTHLTRVGTTGVAMIYVDAAGETEIAVAPGANAQLHPQRVEGAVLCQLEVPDAVIAEAAACAQRSGLTPENFVDVLAKGGGWGAALERLKPFLLNHGDTSNLRFSLSNAAKDLGYYTTYAADTQVDHTVAAAIMKTIRQSCDEGHADAHMPKMIDFIAARK